MCPKTTRNSLIDLFPLHFCAPKVNFSSPLVLSATRAVAMTDVVEVKKEPKEDEEKKATTTKASSVAASGDATPKGGTKEEKKNKDASSSSASSPKMDLVKVKEEPKSDTEEDGDDSKKDASASPKESDASPSAPASEESKEKTEDYHKLITYGLDKKVADRLDDIYKTGT